MNFKDYKQINELKEIFKTEQSEVFLTNDKKICKHYFNLKDKENECFFYNLAKKNNLIKTPRLFYVGKDFIEIEFLKKEGKIDLTEVISSVSNLYKRTMGTTVPLQHVGLSPEKLFHRLNYLQEEIKKREVNPEILERAKSFVSKRYIYTKEECLIHGDLKSPHIFQKDKEVKFIDFALAGIANPFYDLSFLCMEEQEDKEGVFNQIMDFSFYILKDKFDLTKERTSDYLKSSIFYRTLYLFGFALRHREQKSLDRIINELNNILTD